MGAGDEGFDALDPVVQHHIVNSLGWPGLRPLQEASIGPVIHGHDALLLAPTAGGKTEAAMFPLLTRMTREGWDGTSVLYICPLKALLNNLHPRLAGYAGWLGRTCALRHGDIGAGARRRQVIERPDILLTTPESIESMLVSTQHDPRDIFSGVRAVVVDEVHAFAGDDRGWHLLAVLERVAQIAGRPIQRIGCSATVGNTTELLGWLQGGNRTLGVPADVVNPPAPSAAGPVELDMDYVGSVPNAAMVVARLHQGEKRLVFADSRRRVEEMAVELRQNGTETFVSHSSLSLDERRRAETAFAEARDCVIVSTSTLELGIDVGDLDRMIQLGSPGTVASFLQRLGRTGRRPGTTRNALFLETSEDELLRAAGMLLLWSEGYVEAISAPELPLHLVAQQILGLTLQRRTVAGDDAWDVLKPLNMCTREQYDAVIDHLLEEGFLDRDGEVLFIGPAAEQRFGRKHFLDLMAVFLAEPGVTILNGREEVGAVDPMALTMKRDGPRIVALAGRSWLVTSIDWKRRRAYVEPTDSGGQVRWASPPVAMSPHLCDAMRRVLLGATPHGVTLGRRASDRLVKIRQDRRHQVDDLTRVVVEDSGRLRWFTWAGLRDNARRVAALDVVAPHLLDELNAFDNLQIALRGDADPYAVDAAMREAHARFGPDLHGITARIDERALQGLKFSELLPNALALQVAAGR